MKFSNDLADTLCTHSLNVLNHHRVKVWILEVERIGIESNDADSMLWPAASNGRKRTKGRGSGEGNNSIEIGVFLDGFACDLLLVRQIKRAAFFD